VELIELVCANEATCTAYAFKASPYKCTCAFAEYGTGPVLPESWLHHSIPSLSDTGSDADLWIMITTIKHQQVQRG
jgi:hypothetical protein